MTLWETTHESEADKMRESGSIVGGRVRSEIRPATGQRAPAASPQPYILLISASILEREALSLVLERGGFFVHSAGPDIKAIGAISPPDPKLILIEVPSEPEVFHRNWFDELRRVFPRAQLVLLADTLNPDWLVLCRYANLSGYLTKASPTPVILRQLRLIAEGECILPIAMLREIARVGTRTERAERPRIDTLTRRDVDILQYLVAGYPNKVIADKLQLAESTVKVAMKAVFAKIAVSNRTQAAVWALNHGFDKNAALSEFRHAPADIAHLK
jgi:two-component system nitrate/nitrite response regulator NarL